MAIQLIEVDSQSPEARAEIVDFVNRNLELGLPVEDDSILKGKLVLFWAMLDGRRIGVSGYYPKTPFLAETAKTVLAPEERGKGHGVALSQAIEDEVWSRGYKKIVTTIYVTNLPMIFIKLKQGYFFEGFHRDHDRPGLHEYTLGKILADSQGKKA